MVVVFLFAPAIENRDELRSPQASKADLATQVSMLTNAGGATPAGAIGRPAMPADDLDLPRLAGP